MAYSPSYPLLRWRGDRQDAIGTLATAHAAMAEVGGHGRPLELARPIAHAYVLRVVAEFQAFARDLHDLTADRITVLSGARSDHRPMLKNAATEGRYLDRGNADLRSLTNDFMRLGIGGLSSKIRVRSRHWSSSANRRGDAAYYADLIELRNCLAHGNQTQLAGLRARNVPDTITWTRHRLAGLGRTASALDRIVWDHLVATFETEPW